MGCSTRAERSARSPKSPDAARSSGVRALDTAAILPFDGTEEGMGGDGSNDTTIIKR